MNIRKLSLKTILGKDWRFKPDFCYANAWGNAESYGIGDRMILFRREGDTDVSAIHLRAISNYDKKLLCGANKLIADIGIDIKIGDKIGRIIKKFGTPTFIDYIGIGVR